MRKSTKEWFFNFFEKLSKAFIERYLNPNFERYNVEQGSNHINSLKHFFYYAFERGGVSPYYKPVALNVIDDLDGKDLEREGLADLIWKDFERELGNWSNRLIDEGERKEDKPLKPNPKVNPLVPKNTPYKYRGKRTETKYLSVIEFLQGEEMKKYDCNIAKFARSYLERDHVQEAYDKITKRINGVGDKITSLYLRNIAIHYEISVKEDRDLLQPIDTWVERTARLSGLRKLEKKTLKKRIVEISKEYQLNPEKVNCGLWYLGAEIAENYYTLNRLMSDKGLLLKEIEDHFRVLTKTGKESGEITRELT